MTRVWATGWLALLAGMAGAQSLEVTSPPAPIGFENWRMVAEHEAATEYDLAFPSAVVTASPENNLVPLRVFVPVGARGPVPVVLITHYWGARDLRAEVSMATNLAELGVGSAIMALPYHLSRTPRGSHSGDLAIQPDPVRLRQTLIQSVLDMRRSLDFLATRPEFRKDKVGLAGTSLGAIVASLAYGVEPRFTSAAFLLGGVDLAQVIWGSSRVSPQREELRRKGFTEASLREALSDVEPMTYLRNRQAGSTFVIRARYDSVIPSSASQNLVDVLPGAYTLSLETGHYGGIFVQSRVIREIARFFDLTFRSASYEPPVKIFAPTIRLALKVDYPSGFDLAAGADLFRLEKSGKSYATFYVTPRGPEIWLSHELSKGFSVGVSASTRSFGVGLLWSTVL